MKTLYVIERRYHDGQLDLAESQPESVFGMPAITGIDSNAMAKAIFRRIPDAVLTGDSVAVWPALIDSRWIARVKTW